MDRVAPIDSATEIPVVSTLQRPVDPAAIRRVKEYHDTVPFIMRNPGAQRYPM